ncbi:hypothetical protein NDU88_000986 [Pleurodeles waltl]|uniref:Uncharacterized protein n=1 Tax=Pleurodeles waltl TaxID=8319 RepID=A0AAV7LG87_PLEWA|nr:hypothetical protein NDU88_000986 [Pleurodeles waltl]
MAGATSTPDTAHRAAAENTGAKKCGRNTSRDCGARLPHDLVPSNSEGHKRRTGATRGKGSLRPLELQDRHLVSVQERPASDAGGQ